MAKECIPAIDADLEVSAGSDILSARFMVRAGVAAALGLTLANCAGAPQQGARYSSQQQREIGAFASAKYGTASPRVYADNGAPVPKGGGRAMVGNTYRVAGRAYTPHERPIGTAQVGMASWYGAAFHGRKTANGEIYDRRSFSAAHPTMPLPSYARVTNIRNGTSVIVRVNDRGPYHGGRIMDVSERVADALAFKGQGTGRIRVDYLGRAGIGGSDDVRLAQTFRSDGQPAVAEHIPASYPGSRAVQVAMGGAEPVASARPVQTAAYSPRRAPVAATPLPEETVPVAAAATAAVAATPAVAKAETAVQLPARAPLPPSRPFDLGTIPGANTPVRATPQRTASLSFAPHAGGLSSFQRGNPLAHLPPAKFTKTAAKPAKVALVN